MFCLYARIYERSQFNSTFNGPKFGEGDLTIWSYTSRCYCNKRSYEKQIRETEDDFSIDECEIFQVVQKR